VGTSVRTAEGVAAGPFWEARNGILVNYSSLRKFGWSGVLLVPSFLPAPPVSRFESLQRTLWKRIGPALVKGHQLLTPRLDLSALELVLVLGNQKTGSTAIAKLLAHLGRLRAVTDIHPLHAPDAHLPDDPSAVASFLQRMRYYVRHDLVKENELTPATGALLEVLPRARPVFVLRHPVHNIRSILDRVDLPGVPLPLDEISLSASNWRSIVTGHRLGIEAPDHITALAKRWSHMTTLYRRHQDRLHRVRYEAFTADKRATIRALATRLGIEPRQEIQPLLDVSFQPRGAHRSTPPGEFFSAEALDIIHQQCADGMSALDYEPVSVSPS